MKVIAHRGYSAKYAQNTLEAFEQALKLEIDAIEFDVHQVENEFIVFHDFKLDRLTDGNGYIKDKTLDEISKLSIKNKHSILSSNWSN